MLAALETAPRRRRRRERATSSTMP
jgi:hypothetical protein